jgi:hypothetical protein
METSRFIENILLRLPIILEWVLGIGLAFWLLPKALRYFFGIGGSAPYVVTFVIVCAIAGAFLFFGGVSGL